MSKEFWRPVVGFEGFYEVSSHGRVRSVDKEVAAKNGSVAIKKGRVLKQKTSSLGYKAVCLCVDNNRFYLNVHRLVAKAFISNPRNVLYVDHINTDRADNRVENLRWVTAQENCRNPITASKKGLPRPYMRGSAAYNARPVINADSGEIFGAVVDAAKSVGLCPNSIRQAIRNGTRCGGFRWKYYEDSGVQQA